MLNATDMTSGGREEARMSITDIDAEGSGHSDVLNRTFRNSVGHENRQLELYECPQLPVHQEQLRSETEKLGAVKRETAYKKTVSTSTFYVECCDGDSSTTSGEHLYIQRRSRKDVHEEDHHHLFHCILLVGLTVGPGKTKVPYMLIKYPPDAVVPPYTEQLLFPDAQRWTPSSSEQSYSLVLTSETGQRKFGYCRRVLPEGSPACLPLAYCILTPFRARGFYHSLLKELESRHGQPHQVLLTFISSLYNSRFPEPGQTIQLVPRNNYNEEVFLATIPTLRRPHDLRLEEQDLLDIFDILEIPVLLNIFGSLLLERKIIFVSSSFSKLSSCAEAILSILYPFSWQHVLISVLPHSLLDICQSPTPYVVGVLDDAGNRVLESLPSFEQGIIVNLDDSKVLFKVGDESKILPNVQMKNLRSSLELAKTAGVAEPAMRNALISEAFLRTFLDICADYRNHILTLNGEMVFDRESFIKSASSSSIRLFLEWFVETSMFTVFIDIRLQNDEEDRFDQRALERTEEQWKHNRGGKKKSKNLKDRFKSWTRKW